MPDPAHLPGMRRIVVAIVAAAGVALVILAMRPTGAGMHVSGDGARSLATLSTARVPGAAALEVVLLRRWQNLESLPAVARLCRGACDGSTWAVEVMRPGASGLRRILLLDLSALEAGASLDRRGTPPPDVVACLRAGLPDISGGRLCDRPVRRVWRLPGGL